VISVPDDYFVRAYLRVSADLVAGSEADAAAAAVAEAVRQRPGNFNLLKRQAEIAVQRSAPEAALRPLLERYVSDPTDSAAHFDLGHKLLHGLGRPADAAILFAHAVVQFPTNAALYRELAWATGRMGDLDTAVRYYQRAMDLDPDNLDGLVAVVAGLRDLGRYDDADAILRVRRAQFGDAQYFLQVSAWVAHYRGDWPEAMRRWELLRDRFPDETISDWMIGRILGEHLGRPAEAEAVLLACAARHPTDLRVQREYARLPIFSGQWATSLKRWQELAAIYPDDLETLSERGQAELQVQIIAIDAGTTTISLPAADGSDERRLFMGFESLGVNCEFGLVQRHFGAEPLGFLRWSAIHPDALAEGLAAGFDGVDALADIDVRVVGKEYVINQIRYRMDMHTFIYTDTVYQYGRLLEEAEMAAIEAPIRHLGSAAILFVNDQSTDWPNGHVVQSHPGRLIGYVDKILRGEPWSAIHFESYLTMCRNARALVPFPDEK